MRFRGAVVGLIVGICAVAGTIWVARHPPFVPQNHEKTHSEQWDDKSREATQKKHEQETKEEKKNREELATLEKDRPAISEKGPYPKIAPTLRVFEFGKMAVSEEQKHTFQVKNVGEAPLLLSKGPTTCTCTIGSVSKSEVPPGGTADIELSWTPKAVQPSFAQSATIWSNDPDLPEMQFKIIGKVVRRFIVIPAGTWNAGRVTDVQDGEIKGIVGSEIDPEFKVTSVEPADPKHVKVEVVPLPPKDAFAEGLHAGKKFIVRIDRSIPLGHFRSRLRIHTSVEGGKTIETELTADRQGPILFMPPVGAAIWNPEKAQINLSRFKHQVGRKVELPTIVYGLKEPFKMTAVDVNCEFVKVSAVPHPEITEVKGQQGFHLVFEVIPGAPPLTRMAPVDPVHIVIKSNHPLLKEIRFDLEFASY